MTPRPFSFTRVQRCLCNGITPNFSAKLGSVSTKLPTARQRNFGSTSASRKDVWVETTSQQTFTSALEAGATTFLFQEADSQLIEAWQRIAAFDAVLNRGGDLEQGGKQVGSLVTISSKEDIASAESLCDSDGRIVMDSTDWRIIPAENLVASFQGKVATLFGVANSSQDARTLLEALEIGTDGVVLRSNDPTEARALLEYVRELEQRSAEQLELAPAKVIRVQQLGMGDRVAVDLCSLLVPGEGLLAGSFSRGLFVVHSECCESQYINSRPFRINCGPVHSYCSMPGSKTAYLSELKSGAEVLVVNADGRQRVALVGRVKIETRPLVLVEVEIEDDHLSIVLQNAETVRLVSTPQGDSVSVTQLSLGDTVLVHRQAGARHTGIAIQESILER